MLARTKFNYRCNRRSRLADRHGDVHEKRSVGLAAIPTFTIRQPVTAVPSNNTAWSALPIKLDRRGTSVMEDAMIAFFSSITAFAAMVVKHRGQLLNPIGRRGLETVAETIHAPAGAAHRAITGREGSSDER